MCFVYCSINLPVHLIKNSIILLFPRIAVLDDGRIVEYDSPSKLLSSKESLFSLMSREAGLIT